MSLKSLTPIIYAKDLEATIAFYCAILGFTIKEKNSEWVRASLLKEGAEIIVTGPNILGHLEDPHFTGSFLIETDDLDGLWNELKGKVKVILEPIDVEWGGRQFALMDNNGYVLIFGQKISRIQNEVL